MMGAAERAVKASLAGKGYAAVVRAAEGLDKSKKRPKRKREPWVENLMTKIKEILYAEKTYADKKFPPTGRMK